MLYLPICASFYTYRASCGVGKPVVDHDGTGDGHIQGIRDLELDKPAWWGDDLSVVNTQASFLAELKAAIMNIHTRPRSAGTLVAWGRASGWSGGMRCR